MTPASCGDQILWTRLTPADRQELWNATCEAQHHVCARCSGPSLLHWHELWEYHPGIRKWIGLQGLCDLCYHLQHADRASMLAVLGELDWERVVRHFMEVNACSRETFRTQYREAVRIWKLRSRQQREEDLSSVRVRFVPRNRRSVSLGTARPRPDLQYSFA